MGVTLWEVRLKMGKDVFSVPSDSYSAEEGFYCQGRIDEDFAKRFLDCMQRQNTRSDVFRCIVNQAEPYKKRGPVEWFPVLVYEMANNAFSNEMSFKVVGRERRAIEDALEELQRSPAEECPPPPPIVGRPVNPGDL